MAAVDPAGASEALERPPPSAVFNGATERLGAPTGQWCYEDIGGRLFYQCRYEVAADPSEGREAGKSYRPWVWCTERGGWIQRGPPKPTALYHLNLIQERPEAHIYIVEGEKCADALQGVLSAAGTAVATTAWGGAAAVKYARWELLAGRSCVLWPDNDDTGRQAMAYIAGQLFKYKASVIMVEVPRETFPKGWDVADAIEAGWSHEQIWDCIRENGREVTVQPAQVVELKPKKPRQPRPPPEPAPVDPQAQGWRGWGLDLNGKGMPWEHTENVSRVLDRLSGTGAFGDIWYDEFAVRIMTAHKGGSRAWEDADTISLQCFLQANLEMKRISKHLVHDGVTRHARKHTRNPVREWFAALKWDGTERLPVMLERGWGAIPSAYHAAVGRCFLMGAAARILKTPCKVDNMPVFEGAEGIKKSQALEAIAGDGWFDAPQYRFGDRDFYLSMAGKLILELADLSNFEGVALESILAGITKKEDIYRAPYDRLANNHPRMCVFAGTTNKTNWNRHEHGARRFWPVRCGTIDLHWIRENREQLFAEAVARLDLGEPWWDVPVELAQEEQADRRERDPWEFRIASYLANHPQVEVEEILVHALGLEKAQDQTQTASRRVCAVLRTLHWTRRSVRDGHRVYKAWVHSEAIERAIAPPQEPATARSNGQATPTIDDPF